MAESKIYNAKQFPTMLVEILEQDRFTALLRSTYSDDPEAKEYILATKLTVTDDVVDWRRAIQYDTLEAAKEMRVKYDKSFRISHYGAILNTTCKDCINASNRDTYYYDLTAVYKNIIEEETPEDVETALALYTRSKSWDGRISKSNKAWAEDYLKDKPENNIKSDDFGSDFIHPAIAESFIDVVRNAAEERQKEQEQTKADDVDLIIVRKNIGDKSDNLKRMKDYALSVAAYIEDFESSLGHIDIFTTHTDGIKQAADELGLVCVFKEQPTDRLTFDIPKELQKETHFVKTFKAEVEYAKTCKPFNAETNPFNVTFCGTTYDKREDAGNKIYEIIKSGAAYNTEYPLGDYRGYALSVTFSAASNAHVLILRHNDFKIETLESESPIGMTIKLDNLIDKEMEKLLVAHSEKLAALSKEKESCEKHFNDVFDREQELIDKEKRLNELTKALSFDEASDKNADMLDDTDDNIIGTPDKDGRK